MRKFTGRFITLILLFFFNSLAYSSIPGQKVENGILDLRTYEGEFKSISLDGNWEFYWSKLLSPSDFRNGIITSSYVKVPAYWTSYEDDIAGITRMGFGTYRIKVLLPKNTKDSLAVKIPIFDSSCKIYVNGKYATDMGLVGESFQESEPSYEPQVYSFYQDTDTLEIIVQVSNFQHRKGGFWLTMDLGTKKAILEKYERNKVMSYALMGIFFMTTFLFLTFFFIEKSNLSFLFFGLTTLGIFLRLVNTGLYPGNFFMDQQWLWTVRSEYIGTFIAYTFGMLYLNEIFPSKRVRKITYSNAYLFLILGIIVALFKPPMFYYTMIILEVFGALFLSYYIYTSFIGMLNGKKRESVFFFSVLAFLIGIINDSLVAYSMSPFNSEYLLHIIFLVFIVIQAFLVLDQWIAAYKEKAAVYAELQYVNRNLETIIKRRTVELDKSNRELKSSLDVKNRMFSIIAHDLKSPIATLAQHAEMIAELFPEGENSELVFEFQRLSNSSIDLIDNLLLWGLKQTNKIQYKPEQVNIDEIIDEISELTFAAVKNKNQTFSLDYAAPISAYCDSSLLRICLRNLITNAIKFTPESGAIEVSVKKQKDEILVSIVDNGIGIEDQIIKEILETQTHSTYGTSGEKGTGLGLLVVKDLVMLNKGRLDIKSKPGSGTSVSFSLPGKP